MRSFRKFKFLPSLVALLFAAGVISSPTTPVSAQGVINAGLIEVAPSNIVPVSNTMLAADTSPALYIKFVGSSAIAATSTVAVEADGNLTFVYNGAAYTGFECPVSGALGGVIDVSDAACDTLGEVVDIINADTSPGAFRAVIAAGLRSDSSNDSFLADAADTEVTTPNGEIVYWDSSILDDHEVGLWDYSIGARAFLNGTQLPKNPFADRDTVLLYSSETITNAGNLTDYYVYAVRENYVVGGTGSETVRVMYLEASASSTNTGKIDEFLTAGGLRARGEKVFVRVYGDSADSTAIKVIATGFHQYRNR